MDMISDCEIQHEFDTVVREGLSPEARLLGEEWSDVQLPTITFATANERLATEFAHLWEECREANWDGYGAAPLSQIACRRAVRFLQVYPLDWPLPELSATPEGDLALDWDFAPRRTLTVLVTDGPRLVFAAIHGDEEWSGTASFTDRIPHSILAAIDTLSPRRHAA